MTQAAPKPIETLAYGRRFRSRTEARWAVAFTEELIQWEYELEGFELPSGRYLPDFWLPQVQMWAEVKADRFSVAELHKAHDLANATGKSVLLLAGQPADAGYWAIHPDSSDPHGWPEDVGDGVKVDCCDYWPFEGSQYHLSEKRFYACSGTGGDFPSPCLQTEWISPQPDSIRKALSARFEHGEVVK